MLNISKFQLKVIHAPVMRKISTSDVQKSADASTKMTEMLELSNKDYKALITTVSNYKHC